MSILNPLNVPCGPVLSMRELSQEASLRATGTVVEVDHPERGKYLTVGNPIKLSDSPADVRRSPLLGEHTDEVLSTVLEMDADAIAAARTAGRGLVPDSGHEDTRPVVNVTWASTVTVFRWIVGTVPLLFLWLGGLSAAAAPAALALQVTHQARSVQPGEVVILEVAASEPPVDISGEVFGAAVRFYPAETEATTGPDHSVWRALVGIDLDTATGEHAVVIRATSGTGSIVHANYTLTIEPKEFPTRRLTVAPNYVNPPAETIERIQREVVLQRQIFTTSSAERLWRGGFLRPVPGESSSSFGRRSVFNGRGAKSAQWDRFPCRSRDVNQGSERWNRRARG